MHPSRSDQEGAAAGREKPPRRQGAALGARDVAGELSAGRRVTISDIARRAGVSKGAVSYALNGRPGLSESTRARILRIADDLGWRPNRAARSLSVARASACGLVLARPAKTLGFEPFLMELIAGVESELSERSIALTIQLAEDVDEEVAVYERWWAERRVDGVLVVDLRVDDPRVPALTRLRLPSVLIGGPLDDRRLPAVWHDEPSVVEEVVRYLAALGHARIGRVAGVGTFLHTSRRTAAFQRVTRQLSLWSKIVPTDYTPEAGARATRLLLSEPEPPTAIVFDSNVLAVTGLGVAQQMGFAVPDDVSIVAWDDSLLCQVVHPPLTAVSRDISAHGAQAAKRLLVAIEVGSAGDVETSAGVLTPRASTGPARRQAGRRAGRR